MARVDFYVLEQADEQARLRLACRLAEKAWSQSQKVLLLAAGADEARTLDEMLWTFRDRSFVPHEIYSPGQAPRTAVLISDGNALPAQADVLINLCDAVPEGLERYARVVEPLDGDPARRQSGRERFRFYREHSMNPESHAVQNHNEL
jgi:DNA polymerase III subunit chi